MKKTFAEIKESKNVIEVTLRNKKAPLVAILFLGLNSLVVFALPFTVLYFALERHIKIGIWFILTLSVGFGTGFFFLKLLLWNSVGSERIFITPAGVTYYCDYKFFKTNRKVIGKLVYISLLEPREDGENNNEKEHIGKLVLESNKDEIISHMNISQKSLRELFRLCHIKKWCSDMDATVI